MPGLFNFGRDTTLVDEVQNRTLYLALLSAAPTVTQTGATMPELSSAGGYARVSCPMGAPSAGQSSNSGAVSFPQSTAPWSATATYWALADSATLGAGNAWYFGQIAGINDVQTITPTAQLTAGTYTLTFGGQTTPNVNYNDPATRILELLESLSTIGAGNVQVAFSGNRFDQATPGSLVITFQGTLAYASQTLMTLTPSGVAGGTLSIAHTTTGATGAIQVTAANYTAQFAAGQVAVILG